MNIGYFIPEFPGQTHIFFWREMEALRARGVHPEVLSTRLPPRKIMSHTWAEEAQKQTVYLYPPGQGAILGALGVLLRAGPIGWWRCLRLAASGEGGVKARLRLLPLIFLGAQLAWIARQKHWPHLHVHSCGNSAHIAAFAHVLSGLPYSLTLHGPLRDYGLNQKQKWRHAAFGIIITRKLIDEANRELAGHLPPVIELAPMGVDLARFQRQAPYRPWDGSGPCRIFACGRLNPCKAHDDLVRAVGLLRDQGIQAYLSIAGEDDVGGTYRQLLQNLVAELKLEDRVKLLGAVPEETVRGELEAAHIFALASLEEPLGVVIMEAMAMQLPVVVTGAGGVAELVDDGSDGLLVPPRDPARLAEALGRVLRDPALATRLSAAARRKIETTFHSGRSAEVLRDCLQRLHGPMQPTPVGERPAAR